jgi:hypothetical protein
MKWEYKLTSMEDEEEMNALGQEGWELVCVSDLHLMFKRPIIETKEQ